MSRATDLHSSVQGFVHVYETDMGPKAKRADKLVLKDFTTEGDATFVIGKNKLKFLVKTVCLTQVHFFKTLLDGPFKEGTKEVGKTREINFSDDDALAMHYCLCILHANVSALPTDLDIDDSYATAMLCDKYDIKKQMGPFLRDFVPQLNPTILVTEDTYMDDVRKMYIAWTFGLKVWFEVSFRKVRNSITITPSETGDILFYGPHDLADLIFPPGVVEALCRSRLAALSSIVDRWAVELDNLLDSCEVGVHGPEPPKRDCAARIYGQMSRFLKSLGMRPGQTDMEQLCISLSELVEVDWKKVVQRCHNKKCEPCIEYGNATQIRQAVWSMDEAIEEPKGIFVDQMKQYSKLCDLDRWVPEHLEHLELEESSDEDEEEEEEEEEEWDREYADDK